MSVSEVLLYSFIKAIFIQCALFFFDLTVSFAFNSQVNSLKINQLPGQEDNHINISNFIDTIRIVPTKKRESVFLHVILNASFICLL